MIDADGILGASSLAPHSAQQPQKGRGDTDQKRCQKSRCRDEERNDETEPEHACMRDIHDFAVELVGLKSFAQDSALRDVSGNL